MELKQDNTYIFGNNKNDNSPWKGKIVELTGMSILFINLDSNIYTRMLLPEFDNDFYIIEVVEDINLGKILDRIEKDMNNSKNKIIFESVKEFKKFESNPFSIKYYPKQCSILCFCDGSCGNGSGGFKQ